MDINQTVYKLCTQNKDLRDFLISKGINHLSSDTMFNTMAKMIKLKDALKLKNIDAEIFQEEYKSFSSKVIENENFENKDSKYTIEGAVPCPIRVPLMESLKDFSTGKDIDIDFDLRSANLGMDFVFDKFKNKKKLPDLITTAGFELILDDKIYEEVKKSYTDCNIPINDDFIKRGVDLKDPEGIFHILGIVPAVFIVNKELLGSRKMPNSWEDLLSGEFENSITIPVADLDMYNAILITIYAKFGLDGVKKLKDGFFSKLHPAQMVKADRNNAACISICPYFFATMISSDSLKLVWPKEGAVISPIFMTAKKESLKNVKDAIDYFTSEKVGQIFSFNGKFPSTVVGIDNNLSEDQKFLWAGWEMLNNKREKLKSQISQYFDL